jgi:hypothetical protein
VARVQLIAISIESRGNDPTYILQNGGAHPS